jgi:hypothetical protein
LAKDKNEFLEKLSLALQEKDNVDLLNQRMKLAQKNSWQERHQKISHTIKDLN